jgi:hypothetical protein
MKYELMALADLAIDNLDKSSENLSEDQKKASIRFQQLMEKLGEDLNAKECFIAEDKMEELIQVLNRLCFLGALPEIEFGWCWDTEWAHFALYEVYDESEPVRILMHRSFSVGDRHFKGHKDKKRLARLSTLLHEMVHAFLERFCCETCPTFQDNHGSDGHGRAWLMIAAKIEEVSPRLLDLPVNLSKLPSLMEHMAIYGELPSRCDLERWNMLPEAAGEKQEKYPAIAKILRCLDQKHSRKRKADDAAVEPPRPTKRRKKAPLKKAANPCPEDPELAANVEDQAVQEHVAVKEPPRKKPRLVEPEVDTSQAEGSIPPKKKKRRQTTDRNHWLAKKRKPENSKPATVTKHKE